MKSTSESLLADLAKDAGATRWAEFVSIYEPIIRCFLKKKYNFPESDLDDMVQNILIEVVKMMPTYRYSKTQKQRFHSLLFTIAQRRAIDFMRRRGTYEAALSGYAEERQDEPDPRPDEADWRQVLLSAALQRIMSDPSIQETTKVAFRRYVVMGEDAALVANELGLKPNALYQIRNRLIARLQDEVCQMEGLTPYED